MGGKGQQMNDAVLGFGRVMGQLAVIALLLYAGWRLHKRFTRGKKR